MENVHKKTSLEFINKLLNKSICMLVQCVCALHWQIFKSIQYNDQDQPYN